jgi:hypothetical protein
MRPALSTSVSRVRHNATGATLHAEARPEVRVVQRSALIVLFVLTGLVNQSFAAPQADQANREPLKQLSLAELGNVEVTTASFGALAPRTQ